MLQILGGSHPGDSSPGESRGEVRRRRGNTPSKSQKKLKHPHSLILVNMLLRAFISSVTEEKCLFFIALENPFHP